MTTGLGQDLRDAVEAFEELRARLVGRHDDDIGVELLDAFFERTALRDFTDDVMTQTLQRASKHRRVGGVRDYKDASHGRRMSQIVCHHAEQVGTTMGDLPVGSIEAVCSAKAAYKKTPAVRRGKQGRV